MNDAVPEARSAEPGIARPVPGPGHAGPQPPPEGEPSAPAPLNVPRTPTGNAEVDARLERLADADHLATDGHVEVYEDVHRGLRDALTALDAHPGPPAPAPRPGPSGHPSDLAHGHRS
ncbi:hypothetical protein [Streptomyces sp. Tu 3180]|uniref:hypothetical protein n=1 Tax=Streptomyces sp. Tu 3180 TaxID=2682611 RepID=UPI00135ACF1B|nr:hypothetical protein [Streptomyces sp. Tu 3180]KAF3464614.1 hypothetical protein GL259_10015 [Streptomyces sp. Tu 3180]